MPHDTIAIVFTDIEGSTALWERVPAAMRRALDLHNRALRALIVEHEGYEVKAEGDAFMMSFAEPRRALDWCLAAQDLLLNLEWPETLDLQYESREIRDSQGLLWRGLRVRIGGYLGAPERVVDPQTGRYDYFGPAANRAARVCGAAHGGQVLVSAELWEAAKAGPAPAPDAVVTDHGLHRFKGVQDPEHILEISTRALSRRRFPPIRTTNVRRTNLSAERTPFVGRTVELAQIGAILNGDTRLVTLLGPGGTGKTRLARQLGARQLERYDGVWFCDLSEARTLSGVAQAVADALSLPLNIGSSGSSNIDQIAFALEARGRPLVILDNLEQVVAPGAEAVARWRGAAPLTTFLVTSREPLHLPDEARVYLDPLSAAEGAELFRTRLQGARGRQATLNSDDVALLIERLEGLPLAIELAAARSALLSPKQILQRLSQRFELLKGNASERGARHATLRAAIDWSWDLLDDAERVALCRSAVFRGGFSLEAAEAVLGDPGASAGAMDLLQSLMDKSLLRVSYPTDSDEDIRFHLLESIREYADEHLENRELPELAHAVHYAKYGLYITESLAGPEGATILHDLARERDNLLAVHERLIGRAGHEQEAVLATLALDALASLRGPMQGRLALLDAALVAAERLGDAALAARVLIDRGDANRQLGNPQSAEADLQRAIALADDSSDASLSAQSRRALGNLLLDLGRRPEAAAVFEAALADAQRAGARVVEAWVHTSLGVLAIREGRLADAKAQYLVALQGAQAGGDRRHEATVRLNLGVVLRESGDAQAANDQADAAVALLAAMGDRRGQGMALNNLGILAMHRGLIEDSNKHFRGALLVFRDLGFRHGQGTVLNNLAMNGVVSGALGEARAHAEVALAIAQADGDRNGEAVSRGVLADIFLSGSDVEAARRELVAAIGFLAGTWNLRTLGYHRAQLGGVLARLDQREEAGRQLDQADEELGRAGNPAFQSVVDLHRGHLDLALARHAAVIGADPAPHLAQAHARVAAARGLEGSSPEVKLALAHLREDILLNS